MRTPLNVVENGLKIVAKNLKSNSFGTINLADTVNLIEECNKSCQVAVQILHDFLAYVRLDAGLMTLDKTAFQVWTFIDNTIKPFFTQVSPMAIPCLSMFFSLFYAHFSHMSLLNEVGIIYGG